MSDFNGFSNGVTNYINSCFSEQPWLDIVNRECQIILGELLKNEAMEWRKYHKDTYWEHMKSAFLDRLHRFLYEFIRLYIRTSKQYLENKNNHHYIFISELALFSLDKISFYQLAIGYWNDDLLDFQLIQKVYQEGR